ncbi:acyl carrier protein [Roseobacter denitrificans]|uniref:[acyl-carrier-protein] S-malonyltransferase n=1 Tax=Roseobacter denitrificans (strain ATCC 33942 / OCh 114) TaxID=375451 RepID=Q164Z6_ROSDO|nr:acyl carrier protein [Roseobacter denitrificans]ABG32447.1 malonyl CoA-acyl carrier protein transacylase, putative [Roseobacter denitrificans OCh 114]AVL51908.1 acyl carrier protein [Roseobacter denitrificans]SFF81944.1 [acyl-carrier-protein] S-malonyltransferase [Roseobacter denitrificans OCh 114]
MSKTAVVICPGRGTYTKSELGYLARHHGDAMAHLAAFDRERAALGQQTLADLDGAARYQTAVHTRGDNASALIYAASFLDAQKIPEQIEVVGVTGNSMGWYSALAVSGAATPENAFRIVNTMGTLMQDSMIGGQSLYPFVDENWRQIPGLRDRLLAQVAEIDHRPDHRLAVSIHLGGMLVVAGNDAGLSAFEQSVTPVQGRFPMRLANHAAFHTALQEPVAAQGRAVLGAALFQPPRRPLIDGRGAVWYPKACTIEALRAYTLGHQVVAPYDFTSAITVAARTFAPDLFIITGPGTTLGGAVAQALISIEWQGMTSKEDFQSRQRSAPVLLSMGLDADRARLMCADF